MLPVDDDCAEGWRVFDCLDDGTVMHGEGCNGDCDLWDFTAASEGRCDLQERRPRLVRLAQLLYSCTPATYFYDEDLDGRVDEASFGVLLEFKAARAARGILPWIRGQRRSNDV